MPIWQSKFHKKIIFILVCFLMVIPIPSVSAPAELTPSAKSEISHLLDYIERSGCEFNRNGTWYTDTKAVREHVERKYDFFMKKGKIISTEDFIKWAATKSEMSGKPYTVKCPNGPQIPMSQWLREELERYRQQERRSFLK